MTRPLQHAQVLGRDLAPIVRVAQVPHVPGQRWVALDQPAAPVDGAASLLLQDAPAAFTGALCGLLVDEWTELVPSRDETTGIAFRYDPPDASAPQALLLAVPPVMGEPWTVGGLNQVLLETLDLARIGHVGPATSTTSAHFLPATSSPSTRTATPCPPTSTCSPPTWRGGGCRRSPPGRGSNPSHVAAIGVLGPVHGPVVAAGRQWQVGEFAGQDAGTPIVARWRGSRRR